MPLLYPFRFQINDNVTVDSGPYQGRIGFVHALELSKGRTIAVVKSADESGFNKTFRVLEEVLSGRSA